MNENITGMKFPQLPNSFNLGKIKIKINVMNSELSYSQLRSTDTADLGDWSLFSIYVIPILLVEIMISCNFLLVFKKTKLCFAVFVSSVSFRRNLKCSAPLSTPPSNCFCYRGRDSYSGSIGMAFVGTVCSQVQGGSISTVSTFPWLTVLLSEYDPVRRNRKSSRI